MNNEQENIVFIDRLILLIKEKGVTRKVVQDACGISKNQIKRWEDGGTMPNAPTVAALADYFGVSSDFLLGKTDKRKKPSESESLEELMEKVSAKSAEHAEIIQRLSKLDDKSFQLAADLIRRLADNDKRS